MKQEIRPDSRRLVLVTGMHRSGTSAAVRLLNLAGAALGGSLMPARPGENEFGFWEPLEVVRIHDRLLGAFESFWHTPFEPGERWWKMERVAPYREELRTFIESEMSGERFSAVKDPRLSRLLPLWIDLLGELRIEPALVLMLRHPVEVARSLERRDGISPTAAYGLWLDHVLRAEQDSRCIPRSFVTFDALLADWRGSLERIGTDLCVRWPHPPGHFAGEAESFLDPRLRHHRAAAEAGREALPDWIARAWSLVETAARHGESESFRRALDELHRSEHRARASLAPWLRDAALRSRHAEDLAWARELIRTTSLQLQETEHHLAEIRASRTFRYTRVLREIRTQAPALLRSAGSMFAAARAAYAVFRREGVPGLVRRSRRALGPRLAASGPPAHVRPVVPPLVPVVGDISLPHAPSPEFSIVIPAYNHAAYTFRCLEAIIQTSEDLAYEVVLVDDASSDSTAVLEHHTRNLRIVRNRRNIGFIDSCNRGAQAARGTYVVFLNNDTVPQAGWLRALRDTFIEHPNAGMVGAKLLEADGRLQEAGGIVWRDGSAWNYGRGDSPLKPEYSFLRDTDYCSGACLAVRRSLFLELGGFDPRFRPAYYEDTDLAFAVRGAGLRVLYQPRAAVVHFEGTTSGTDVQEGVKRHQLRNQQVFREKWARVLEEHASPPPYSDARLAPSLGCTARVLVVDARVPMPDHDSGSLRMRRILDILTELGCRVTLVAAHRTPRNSYSRALADSGVETFCADDFRTVRAHLRERRGYYDVVLLSRLDVARKHLGAVRRHQPEAAVLFDTVDLHFVREGREAELNHARLRSPFLALRRRRELDLARRADVTLVVSPAERDRLAESVPEAEIEVLSNIHELRPPQTTFEDRYGVVFLGSFEHPPNVDAIRFYLDEIQPRVRERGGDIPLYVIGSDAPSWLRARTDNGVTVLGQVPELEPYLERCRLSVAPLRFGAGVKGKINSSMSHGVPVVSTPIGAEGMQLVHGESVLLAEDAEDFARSVVELHSNRALWLRLSRAGLENVRQNFSVTTARDQLSRILGGLLLSPHDRPGAEKGTPRSRRTSPEADPRSSWRDPDGRIRHREAG